MARNEMKLLPFLHAGVLRSKLMLERMTKCDGASAAVCCRAIFALLPFFHF